MSRVESMPTHELWGMSEELWIKFLVNNGMIDVMIKYYEQGLVMMAAENRDIIGTHRYKDIVGTKTEKVMFKRQKTEKFYRLRLKELKG